MAHIAVTGATGFIGGTVAAVLAQRGHEVRCLTRRPVDLPWPSQAVDFTDPDLLAAALDGCGAVAHLAILNDFAGMYADRRAAYDGYVGLTRRIVDAANAAGARVGYVSTDWVFDGTGHLVDEDETPNPVNLYGYLKAASELVVLHRASSGFVARAEGVLHFAGGTAVTRRELAEAACRVFDLDGRRVDFAPPPAGARLPAPVPYDTSMSGARTAALLGSTTWPIEDQLASLADELAHGIPVPLTG